MSLSTSNDRHGWLLPTLVVFLLAARAFPTSAVADQLSFATVAWPKATAKERKTAQFLARFSRVLGFSSRINPTADSRKEQKARFFAACRQNRAYEPQFTYRPLSTGSIKLVPQVARSNSGPGRYGPLLDGLATELLTKWRLLKARGSEDFADRAADLYRPPAPPLVDQARRLLAETPPSEEQATVSADEMVKALTKALADYGLSKWSNRSGR